VDKIDETFTLSVRFFYSITCECQKDFQNYSIYE